MFDIRLFINLMHILLIGPLFIFVGKTYGHNLHNYMFIFLILLGIFLMIYHGIKTFKIGLTVGYIYSFHAFYIAPLLLYIGYYREKAFWGTYISLVMYGFSAIGYHLYLLADYYWN